MIALEAAQADHIAQPIDTLERYFDEQGWENARNGDEEIVAHVQAAWGRYELRGFWREEDRVLQLMGLPGLRASVPATAGVYELLGRINEQLWLGHFDLWAADGAILFRHAAILEAGDDSEEALLSYAQAETLIEAVVDECDRYWPAIQFVLDDGKAPLDALAAAMIDVAGEA